MKMAAQLSDRSTTRLQEIKEDESEIGRISMTQTKFRKLHKQDHHIHKNTVIEESNSLTDSKTSNIKDELMSH